MSVPRRLLPTWFDAPAEPPTDQGNRIRRRPGGSRIGLCVSIIRSAGWYAAAGSTLLVFGNIATMLLPVVVGVTIDRGIAPVAQGDPWRDHVGEFLRWTTVVALLYLIMNVAGRFGGRLGWYGVQRARYELSDRVMDRVLDQRGMDGPGRLPGSLLAVVALDVQRACQAIYVVIYPVGEFIAVLVAAVSLILIHPGLGLAVLVGAPLLLAVMALVARPLLQRSEIEQERIADTTAIAADLVTGYRVISGIHAQATASGRYRDVSAEALRGTVRARTAQSVFEGVSAVLTGLFSAAVAVGAAALAFAGEISVGELIAAAGIAQVLLGPLQSLVGEAGSVLAMAVASAGRVVDLLDTPPESPDDAPASSLGALGVRDGEFVVLDVGGGEAAAVVDALARDALRRGDGTVLVAPHAADLFEGSVLDNVVPVDGAGDPVARARAALVVAQCESFEQQLPEGYDTSVGERGSMLSGGQRQRVALARAVAADPRDLVLHEPTNAVDSVSEATIARRLRAARAGRTTVVLTSSAAFMAVADRCVRSDVPIGVEA